jgi:hypothetical protein
MYIFRCVCFTAGLAAAAEQEKSGVTKQAEKGQIQIDRRPAGQGVQNREEMYKEMLASRANVHAEAIKELTDLKALAEEEKATKTAAAIQAMIDKKNADYQKSVEQFEKQRQERADQLQKRLSERQAQQKTAGGTGNSTGSGKAAETK